MKIKAVLFDMDGVLIEAKDWHYEALNKALSIFGLTITREEHLTTFDGLPTRDKLKIISQTRNLPVELHSYINQLKQKYTIDLINQLCRPHFANEYALSRLHREGYKIAVCSNSIRKTIDLMMEKAALTQYLDLIVSNEDVVNGKPAPDIYLKAMKELSLEPEECLICEDNENGIKAALASGGNLLKINEVKDTNYKNIISRISKLEKLEI